MTLHDDFESVHASLLHRKPFPTLDSVLVEIFMNRYEKPPCLLILHGQKLITNVILLTCRKFLRKPFITTARNLVT